MSNDVEREFLKYESGIRAFKRHVKREDHKGEYLETIENTMTQMNTIHPTNSHLLIPSNSFQNKHGLIINPLSSHYYKGSNARTLMNLDRLNEIQSPLSNNSNLVKRHPAIN